MYPTPRIGLSSIQLSVISKRPHHRYVHTRYIHHHMYRAFAFEIANVLHFIVANVHEAFEKVSKDT